VNVLIYAFRKEDPRHAEYRAWLDEVVNGPAAYGMSDLALSGFVRIVTHPKVFKDPDPLDRALAFARTIRDQPTCVHVLPGERHWAIFEDLCTHVQAKGNLVPDAFFAALAIENGCEWITTDRDYARFPGLRWRHPLGG
jgi:uncharacterized protein